jgi:hypothetical protein
MVCGRGVPRNAIKSRRPATVIPGAQDLIWTATPRDHGALLTVGLLLMVAWLLIRRWRTGHVLLAGL